MSTANPDEARLAQRCLMGDEAAVRTFIGMFQDAVFAVSLKMLGHREDAEDVTQESLLRAVRHLGGWDPSRPLKPWILTIAINRCRTAMERRSRLPKQNEIALDLASERREHSRLEQQEVDVAEELQLALSELRDDYRSVFVLFHQQELSYEEIAEVLDRPIGTIKIWLFRARAQLGNWMRERGILCEASL